jgi:tRNA-dihydrouridine synthase B
MTLYLAPLHGVTNRVYRNAYFRHFGGFDGAIAPFILAVRTTQVKPRHFKDLLPGPGDCPLPLVPQLLGNEPAAFVETARVLADLGYAEINWNLGCPYSMVANKQRGSGLLPFPGRVGEVLDAACAIPGLRISVKLRLGRYDPSEIIRLMPVLNGHPLAKVVIHARVGAQMYRGKPDLDGFAAAAGLCAHELVYNGDIVDRAAYARLSSRFPRVDGWMIGRGALSNPFLPEELKAASGDRTAVVDGAASGDRTAVVDRAASGDRGARLRAWHDDLYGSYREALCGPAHVLDKMKEAWGYLGASFPAKSRQLALLARARTLAQYETAVEGILER